jgi:dTDP-4-dehydrorhamnose reductase
MTLVVGATGALGTEICQRLDPTGPIRLEGGMFLADCCRSSHGDLELTGAACLATQSNL